MSVALSTHRGLIPSTTIDIDAIVDKVYLSEDDIDEGIHKPTDTYQRLFRCLPAIVLIGSPLLCVYWSFFNPFYYFFFACSFCLCQFYFSAYIAYYSHVAMNNILKAQKKDWFREYLLKLKQQKHGSVLNWDEITHYVMIPNYKENVSVLSETLNALALSSLAKGQIIPVLGMEMREEGAEDKARLIIQKFEGKFKGMLYSLHPPNLPGEMAGKSSNEGWAFKHAVIPDVRRRRLRTESVVMSVCDADSIFHPKHFEALTFKYCTDVNRHKRVFQGPMVNFMNIDTVPAATRLMSTVISLHELSHLCNYKKNEIMPFSTYSYSFNTARDNNGWDPDFICEDWHQFIKCYFNTGGDMRVEALPYPVLCYSVESETWWSSLRDRFEQAKRHAYAMQEIPYFLGRVVRTFNASTRPSLLRTLAVFSKIFYPHYLATTHIFLLIYSVFVFNMYRAMPYWVNPDEAMTVNTVWTVLFNVINGISVIPLISFCLTTHRAAKYIKPEKSKWWKPLQYLLEWALIGPIANLFFGTIPTFMGCVALMFKSEFEYVCAAKPQGLPTDDATPPEKVVIQ
jgi:hypothetical protein